MPPSLFGREPGVAALALILVVALLGGGAMANAVAGPPSNQEDPGSGTETTTPTPTPTATDDTTPTTIETATPDEPTPTDSPATPTETVGMCGDEDGDGEPEIDPEDAPECGVDVPQSPDDDADGSDGAGNAGGSNESPDTDTMTPTSDDGGDSGDSNEPPAPRFVAVGSEFVAGEPVNFTARGAATDPDGEIVGYEWEFGDDETATGENVTHTYDESREYTVSLTATDDDGATRTWSQRIAVEQSAGPVASMCHPTTAIGAPDEPLEFRGQGPDTYEYDWTFTPLAVDGPTHDPTTKTGKEVTKRFRKFGLYNVTLDVTDNRGRTDTQTQSVSIAESPTGECPGGSMVGE